MRLSRFSYYSDFVLYPMAFVGLAGASLMGTSWTGRAEWLCALSAGALLWTLMEYLLHRIAFHAFGCFVPMHSLHHGSPLAFIGTPTWLSMPVLAGIIWVPAWRCFGFSIAGGVTVGVMFGYWWYGVVHHVIHHHAHERSSAYFSDLRTWHMRHHYSPKGGNFGVTTGLWDYVFGTVIGARHRSMVST